MTDRQSTHRASPGSGPDAGLEQELKEDFAEADSDHDGRIDFKEFGALLENLEAGVSEQDLRIGFHEIDTDHDGRINLREFVDWWTEQ
jgi:Ca2+-binding EF-hand superfamily protein